MSFDIYDNNNKLIGVVLTNDYKRVTYCEDCTYFDCCNDVGYCWCHDTMMRENDYCSRAIRKDDEK